MTAPEPVAAGGQPEQPEQANPERAVLFVYAALVAVELVYVADVMTHGAVLRVIEPHARRAHAAARAAVRELVTAVRLEREIRLAARHVVFEAIEATREGAT